MKKPQNGFTLVEIAIVLVIIGLLLGGILKGLTAGAGVKWATGPSDRSDGGRFLPVELQAGTGSTDAITPRASVRVSTLPRTTFS